MFMALGCGKLVTSAMTDSITPCPVAAKSRSRQSKTSFLSLACGERFTGVMARVYARTPCDAKRQRQKSYFTTRPRSSANLYPPSTIRRAAICR